MRPPPEPPDDPPDEPPLENPPLDTEPPDDPPDDPPLEEPPRHEAARRHAGASPARPAARRHPRIPDARDGAAAIFAAAVDAVLQHHERRRYAAVQVRVVAAAPEVISERGDVVRIVAVVPDRVVEPAEPAPPAGRPGAAAVAPLDDEPVRIRQRHEQVDHAAADPRIVQCDERVAVERQRGLGLHEQRLDDPRRGPLAGIDNSRQIEHHCAVAPRLADVGRVDPEVIWRPEPRVLLCLVQRGVAADLDQLAPADVDHLDVGPGRGRRQEADAGHLADRLVAALDLRVGKQAASVRRPLAALPAVAVRLHHVTADAVGHERPVDQHPLTCLGGQSYAAPLGVRTHADHRAVQEGGGLAGLGRRIELLLPELPAPQPRTPACIEVAARGHCDRRRRPQRRRTFGGVWPDGCIAHTTSPVTSPETIAIMVPLPLAGAARQNMNRMPPATRAPDRSRESKPS